MHKEEKWGKKTNGTDKQAFTDNYNKYEHFETSSQNNTSGQNQKHCTFTTSPSTAKTEWHYFLSKRGVFIQYIIPLRFVPLVLDFMLKLISMDAFKFNCG